MGIMNFAQILTYRFDGNWEKQILRHTGFPVEIGSFSDSFWYALFEIDIFPIHFVTTFISYCQFS